MEADNGNSLVLLGEEDVQTLELLEQICKTNTAVRARRKRVDHEEADQPQASSLFFSFHTCSSLVSSGTTRNVLQP